MDRRTVVNIKKLQSNSKNVSVEKIGKHLYRASSLTKKLHYLVTISRSEEGFRISCNCRWGLVGEGCSHAFAVARYVLAKRGKVPSFWTDRESASKQKRKVITIGNNLYMTSRKQVIIENLKE